MQKFSHFTCMVLTVGIS